MERISSLAVAVRAGAALMLGAAGAAGMAAPAGAATVTRDAGGTLQLTAAPGETNTVTMRFVADPLASGDDRIVVTDATAPLTSAATGCTVTGTTLSCTPGDGSQEAVARLGDGNDSLVLLGTGPPPSPLATVFGGPGDDRLTVGSGAEDDWSATFGGEAGNDVLIGGQANDRLAGGLGRDTLDGGAASDVLAPDADAVGTDAIQFADRAPFADDAVAGGAAIMGDELTYAGRATPIRADLGSGRAGGTGEADRVTGIEIVRGTPATDVLTGSARGETLITGGGADRVSGLAGADTLRSDGGAPVLRGGSGDDQLRSDGGRARLEGGPGRDRHTGPRTTRFACGPGVDVVEQELELAFARVVVPPECERIAVPLNFGDGPDDAFFAFGTSVASTLSARGGRAALLVRIARDRQNRKTRRYEVRLRARDGSRARLGTGHITVPPGGGRFENAILRVELNARGRRVTAGRTTRVVLELRRVGSADVVSAVVTVRR